MNQEYNYRFATHSDLKQLQQLCLVSYGQFKSIISAENWGKWELSFNNDDTFANLLQIAKCVVCEEGSKIVGMAFLIPHGNPYLFFEADWSYIRLVGVDPQSEGKGIGRKLMELCIDLAKESGENIIALHTSEFQDAARHIYESLGFVKQKELEPMFGKIYFLYILQLH